MYASRTLKACFLRFLTKGCQRNLIEDSAVCLSLMVLYLVHHLNRNRHWKYSQEICFFLYSVKYCTKNFMCDSQAGIALYLGANHDSKSIFAKKIIILN